jgi:hypothetical protein
MGAPNDPNATMDKTAAAQPHASHESPIIYQGEEDIMFQAVIPHQHRVVMSLPVILVVHENVNMQNLNPNLLKPV